jgi:hypothetical protein
MTHADYSVVQTVQDPVPPPLPYETLDDEHTYSPRRTDITGRNTVRTSGSQKMDYGKSVFELEDGPPEGPPPAGGPPTGEPDLDR